MRRSGRWAVLALVVLSVAGGAIAHARDVEIGPTGEAALAQPMAVLAVETGGRRGRGDDALGDLPAVAVVDTGASSIVLSAGTAERFGVEAEPGARYVEVGMSGDHPMAVSRAVTLVVSDLDPDDAAGDDGGARPHRGRRPAPGSVRAVGQRVLLNAAPTDLAAALLSPGTMVDVVGMPVLRDHVLAIEPGESTAAVRLPTSASGLDVDAWVRLDLVDFNHPHARNRGPLPALATNPVIAVRVVDGAAHAAGDWLLDTGAACSMVSTATARRLGLVDADGRPTRPPAFTLPVGGIGGGHQSLPGFRLERLELATDDGRTLVFPRPAVVVHDVAAERADGTPVTLAGILGMNLLLASGNGTTMLGAAEQLPSPFTRIVVDTSRRRLGFTLRR